MALLNPVPSSNAWNWNAAPVPEQCQYDVADRRERQRLKELPFNNPHRDSSIAFFISRSYTSSEMSLRL